MCISVLCAYIKYQQGKMIKLILSLAFWSPLQKSDCISSSLETINIIIYRSILVEQILLLCVFQPSSLRAKQKTYPNK